MPAHGGVCALPPPRINPLHDCCAVALSGERVGGTLEGGGQSLAMATEGGGVAAAVVVVRSGVPRTYRHLCFILFLPAIL